MELQVGFREVLDETLKLLGTRELHRDEFLVEQAVYLVEKCTRWGIYMQDEDICMVNAYEFLERYRGILATLQRYL
jgi:hypothetical protein